MLCISSIAGDRGVERGRQRRTRQAYVRLFYAYEENGVLLIYVVLDKRSLAVKKYSAPELRRNGLCLGRRESTRTLRQSNRPSSNGVGRDAQPPPKSAFIRVHLPAAFYVAV